MPERGSRASAGNHPVLGRRLLLYDAPLDAADRAAHAQCVDLGRRKAGAAMIADGCGCCGRHTLNGSMSDCLTTYANGAIRCSDHYGRNPCAIEGCKRTREAPAGTNGFPYHADDQILCREHWRAYVPPRSRLRRAYHAHFRRAKRQGWTYRNKRAFWRFWESLVKTARRRAGEGFIDETEINHIMGWE